MRWVLVSLLLGCGTSGADDLGGRDLGALDIGAPDGGLCACAPFERCIGGACGCDGDPLCGTDGFATFPIMAPADRELSARGPVVDDALTGLSWERTMADAPLTHVEAADRCAALSLDGHGDWRLPSRVELATILDATRTPTLDADVFGASVADYVWSASIAATGAERAYAIYFGQGETILATADLASGHGRCVRGVREPAEPRAVDGDWLVDAGAGLAWSMALGESSSLAEARAACTARSARVPSLYELHALVDEGRREPGTDPRLAAPSATVWSDTERDLGEPLAWVMDFRDGTSALRGVGERVAFRCVRRIP